VKGVTADLESSSGELPPRATIEACRKAAVKYLAK